ncbi:MAG TPA: methyltransferase regulatory domain-containing protein, partial [Gemmata sp.]|nr:methyltransferase regulatory domain-containing protein [Gemmata sp.]
APVRDGLLALISRCLRQGGVGYLSYNAYPGCYIRRMLWEMLRMHTAGITDPMEKMRSAIELVKFLIAGGPKKPDAPLALLAPELKEILENRDPRVLYHDDLGEFNDPIYFQEFAAHAGRFGLRFVAEAEQFMMETRGFPREVAGVLNGFAVNDVVLKEQYIDFLLLRRFRHTLLTPDAESPREDPDPSRIASLYVSGNPRPDGVADLVPKVAVTFRAGREAAARTDLPIGKAALIALEAKWPARIAFPELVRIAARKLGRAVVPNDEDDLGKLLTATWMAGLIEFNGHNPRYAELVSDRPIASPLARFQLRTGVFASTLLHGTMRFDDEPTRVLVRLLDGTRDRSQLARELLPVFPADKRPDPDSLKAGIERNLERLAKGGMLIG